MPKQDETLLNLIQVSEKALAAAKIEHHNAFATAMNERERLLARLWGFPDDVPLPDFSNELAAKLKRRLSPLNKVHLTKLRELDHGILLALEAQKGRLKESDNLMTRGELFMRNMVEMNPDRFGRRIDRKG